MIALTNGVGNLKGGDIYSLPAYPAQVLASSLIQSSPVSAGPFVVLYGSSAEPGVFVNGGFVKCDVDVALVLKKHLVGKSGANTRYDASVLLDKPSNYWRLNEPSGLVAVDRVNGLNGTISGGVTLGQPGALGGNTAMLFDGVDDKIVTAANVYIPSTFSCEAWFKLITTAEIPIVSTRPATALVLSLGNGQLTMWDGANWIPGNRYGLEDNQWHQCVFVFEGTNRYFYVDGVLDKAVTFGYLWPSHNGTFSIGHDPLAPSYWNGSLDEVAIYQRVLTPSEILNHYKASGR
jgi:Concanavalin A-like lectin/glucanases superfamily